MRYLLIATVLTSACGASSLSPSASSLPTWACAGQSNAAALCGDNQAIDPPGGQYLQAYARIVGDWQGGMPIAQWDVSGPHWPLLETALQTPVNAIVWWQGEEDAADVAYAPGGYLAKLRDLVTRMRIAAHQPDLRVAIVELGPRWRDSPEVSDQRAFVASDGQALLVRTEDLPFRDGTHMNPEGYRQVAARIAGLLR